MLIFFIVLRRIISRFWDNIHSTQMEARFDYIMEIDEAKSVKENITKVGSSKDNAYLTKLMKVPNVSVWFCAIDRDTLITKIRSRTTIINRSDRFHVHNVTFTSSL